MTYWSLSRTTIRGLVVISAFLLAISLTACGSSHGNTAVANPATPKPSVMTTRSAVAAPAAPITRASTEFACDFITKADATAALGFDPGPGHIDRSGAIVAPNNLTICAWGDPMHFDIPVIDMYAQMYPTAKVARVAFEMLKQNEHAAATALNWVRDYPAGYGALIKASPGTGTDKGESSAQVGTGKWIVTIVYYHAPDDTDRNTKIAIKLAQAVVNHRP